MRLKLIPAPPYSSHGAKVINADTGEEINDVLSVKYEHELGKLPMLTVVVLELTKQPTIETIVGSIETRHVDVSTFGDEPLPINCPRCGSTALEFSDPLVHGTTIFCRKCTYQRSGVNRNDAVRKWRANAQRVWQEQQ